MNYNGPKVKVSRRLGIAITPKAARIMEKRPYPPGQHGQTQHQRRSSRMSNYKRQLLEKQRLRAQYNINERQLRNYFIRATKAPGNTGETLVSILETRLDAFTLRAGFARSIYAARQYVTHGHMRVNGRKVNLPSYRLKPGDVVSVREKSRELPCFIEALGSSAAPSYITTDRDAMAARFVRLPDRDEVPIICEVQAIVEFYSR